jgi:glycosyltransferase involved in cell wall biosynthesis
VIAISKEVEINLKKHLDEKTSKIELINNGVNIKVFVDADRCKQEDFFSKEDKILVQVSSFIEPKDQFTLIKSIELLPNHIKLLLVGEGELKQKCELCTHVKLGFMMLISW